MEILTEDYLVLFADILLYLSEKEMKLNSLCLKYSVKVDVDSLYNILSIMELIGVIKVEENFVRKIFKNI